MDLGAQASYYYNNTFGGIQIGTNEPLPTNSQYDITNILCVDYETTPYYDLYHETNNGIALHPTGNGIFIKDSRYTTADEFKTALSGVLLYYELAEPVTEIFDTPLDLTYRCEDFGTEQWVYDEEPFVPPVATINYWSNFIDTLRRLPDVYVKQSKLATVGGQTLLNGGNINFKTIGGTEIIGSGDIPFKTINGGSIIGHGDIASLEVISTSMFQSKWPTKIPSFADVTELSETITDMSTLSELTGGADGISGGYYYTFIAHPTGATINGNMPVQDIYLYRYLLQNTTISEWTAVKTVTYNKMLLQLGGSEVWLTTNQTPFLKPDYEYIAWDDYVMNTTSETYPELIDWTKLS